MRTTAYNKSRNTRQCFFAVLLLIFKIFFTNYYVSKYYFFTKRQIHDKYNTYIIPKTFLCIRFISPLFYFQKRIPPALWKYVIQPLRIFHRLYLRHLQNVANRWNYFYGDWIQHYYKSLVWYLFAFQINFKLLRVKSFIFSIFIPTSWTIS